ncbi:MAG: CHAT domain-containing protein [Phycisphaeraceae bacterium]|nr:CHAT domain-containing protein [Phycisphaerales bacterium]QOJ16440.1 MAG: CHAT domain-containing protein [Phycisphaeraceae bacterium]
MPMTDRSASNATLLEALSGLAPSERAAAVREFRGHDAGAVNDLLLALGDEAERLLGVEVARARAAAEIVVALADQVGGPAARSRARRALGQALAYAGELHAALDVCRGAAVIADQAGEVVHAARARLASIHPLGETGRLDDAVRAGEQAWTMLTEAGEPALAARADLNLGVIHRKRDDPSRAVMHFQRARGPLANEPGILARLESNLGEALLDLNDLDGAEEAFQSSLAAFHKTGQSWGAAIVEGNLADLATRQGRLDRALFHFESARRLLEKDQSPTHLARLLVEQADAKAALGLLDDAAADYDAALVKLERAGQPFDAARAAAGLARVRLRQNRAAEAMTLLDQAANGLRALNRRTELARVELLASERAVLAGDMEEAARLVHAALEAWRERPVDAATARYHLARLALLRGDAAQAEREIEAALSVAEEHGLAPLAGDLLHLRGQASEARGDRARAIVEYRAAIERIERVRGALQADRFRAALLGNRLEPYGHLARALLEVGSPEALAEAFHVVEQQRSRSLLDLVRGVIDPAGAGVARTTEEADLLARLGDCQRRLNHLYRRFDEGRPADPGWRSDVRTLEDEVAQLEVRLSATQGVAAYFSHGATLAEVQRTLSTREALIEYARIGDALAAFVVTPHGLTVRELGCTPGAATDLVRRFHFQIGRALRPGALDGDREARLAADARGACAALYDALIRPLAEHLQTVDRLFIVPWGPLHALPFSALWGEERYLIESNEVIQLPSAALLAHLRERAWSPDRSLTIAAHFDAAHGDHGTLVVGVADARAPRITEEAMAVASMLPGSTLLLGADAAFDRFTEASRNAGLIHVAAHGRFDPGSPLSSGIRLADRWVTMRDVARLSLDGAAVILSGCETGLASVESGEELIGLQRAFLTAGASSVTSSLWIVSDDATLELMRSFYHQAASGSMERSAALRCAQRSMMARRPHPACWASFVQVGLP